MDAVYISLPNTLHREWSVKALEAGKHVICEKPFSRRVEDVEAAFDAAERAGRHLTEAFMYRHNPQTHKLAESSCATAPSASCGHPLGVQLLALRRGQHPPAHRRRRWKP